MLLLHAGAGDSAKIILIGRARFIQRKPNNYRAISTIQLRP